MRLPKAGRKGQDSGMAFKLPTWDDIKKQMALSLICLLVTIPLSVIGQKVLAETHLFDPTARWLSERVVSVGPNTFAWIVAGVISLVLYGFTMQRVWSPRYRDRYHRDLQAETAPVASLGIKVTRAPVRDMSFREALPARLHKRMGTRVQAPAGGCAIGGLLAASGSPGILPANDGCGSCDGVGHQVGAG